MVGQTLHVSQTFRCISGPLGISVQKYRRAGFCTMGGPSLRVEENMVWGGQLTGRTARGLQVLSWASVLSQRLHGSEAVRTQHALLSTLTSLCTGPTTSVYC